MSGINLSAIEAAVSARVPERVPLLIAALGSLEAGQPFLDAHSPAQGYTRLAAATAAILTDRQTAIAPGDRRQLVCYATVLNNLFAASAFRDTGFAIDVLRRSQPADVDLTERQLALMGSDVPISLDIARIIDLPAPDGLLGAINFVAARPILSALGETRRDAVLAQAGKLESLDLPANITALTILTNAWMNCSYSAQVGKHALKPALNTVLRRLSRQLRLDGPPRPGPRPVRDRPVMLVMAEVMHETHVQFRYFGQYLRQLRTRFELVLAAPKAQVSPAVPALFDKVMVFDPNTAGFLVEVRAFAAELAPDVVFWPSVGMARWGPLLANLRLAPIQMTALGHSASTFIPAMDYYLTEAGYVGDPALFSETLLLMPDEALRFEPRPGIARAEPRVRDGEGPAAVGVPSNALKLNPTFLSTLGAIRTRASREVRFELFPNCSPMEAAALQAFATPILGDAVIHPRLSANAYEAALNACDLVLSPFPFGGLHSTVDALRLGLPVLAMEGLEPHSRTDAMILRRVGMPERLIRHAVEDYIDTAVELIHDATARLELGVQALACDIDGKLFAAPNAPLRSEVIDAVWAAYRHHEAIQASGRKVWDLDALRALTAA